jgi:hypothetical protein
MYQSKKPIKSSRERATEASNKSFDLQQEVKLLDFDTKMDTLDKTNRQKRFDAFAKGSLKLFNIVDEFDKLDAEKRDAMIGKDLYNQLNKDNEDAELTEVTIDIANRKQYGKSLMDIGKTINVNKQGVEFSDSDFRTMKDYLSSSNKFKGVYQSMMDNLAIKDKDGKVIGYNDGYDLNFKPEFDFTVDGTPKPTNILDMFNFGIFRKKESK